MTIAEQLRQEGMQKGMQKGIQKGMQQGRQEKRIEIARKSLSIGLDRATIAQATGLSSAELVALCIESQLIKGGRTRKPDR